MTSVAITLTAPRTLEEKLVQLLLDNDVAGAAGFTVREVVAYGRELDFRTVSEQIGSRIRQIEIRLVLAADSLPPLMEWLKSVVRDRDVSWQVMPVSASGDLG